MATLYLDRKGLTLRHEGGRLLLAAGDAAPRQIPLALIERVVIHARTELDTSVLAALAEAGIAVVILSPRRSRRVAVLLGRSHNDVRLRMAQLRRFDDEDWRLAWSRRLVHRKIASQRRTLRKLCLQRPDRRYVLLRAARRLREIERSADEAAALERLRGLEGAASALYFDGFTKVFPPALGFSGRNRRPPRDLVNACLSLGYTLLHFEAVRAAYARGLDPFVGFYHDPAFARESLASDLIEPLRAEIDIWVWERIRTREIEPRHCIRDNGACLLGKEARGRFYRAYEIRAQSLRRGLRRTVALLARRLGETVPDLSFLSEEDAVQEGTAAAEDPGAGLSDASLLGAGDRERQRKDSPP